jgi:hypothetical protein
MHDPDIHSLTAAANTMRSTKNMSSGLGEAGP